VAEVAGAPVVQEAAAVVVLPEPGAWVGGWRPGGKGG